MAGHRKVRIFRDPNKSPNWYVEWRDVAGRRHCESCGRHRRDAKIRALQITEKLRQHREAANRLAQTAHGYEAGGGAPTETVRLSREDSALEMQGLLRCAQVDIPITLRVRVPSSLFSALWQMLREENPQ